MPSPTPSFVQQLRTLANGKTTRICRVDPYYGSLYARKGTQGDVTFSWRFTFQGSNDTEVIGLWDAGADPRQTRRTPKGWTVTAAARQAEAWALEHEELAAAGGFRAVTRQLDREEAGDTGIDLSFGRLLSDYARMLDDRGAAGSAKDVYYAIRLHVELPFNHIYRKPATQVSQADIIDIMKRAGTKLHALSCRKLRGYMQTAYQRAIDSVSKPDIPECFRAYKIVHNVVKDVANPDLPRGESAPIKALSVGQMRWYWEKLQKVEGIKGATLRLQLLTGGQRPAQLVRLKRANIGEDSFLIYDLKGRNAIARPHRIPITPTIAKTLAEFDEFGTYPMSATGGQTPLVQQTLTNWAQEVVGDHIPGFQLKWVRSGVETLMSKWKIDKEHRGRLQSHGVGGVQDKHYNADDFLDVKGEALQILEHVLNGVLERPPVNPILEMVRLQQELAQAQASNRVAA